MARGRLLTIELLNDDRLNQMSEKAQRLFLRAWPHLDRDGRITGNARRLWAQIDVDQFENMDRIAACIDEWIASGLVMRYESGKGPVLFFVEFRLHNLKLTYTEEAASVWPPPPGWHNSRQGPIPDCPELAERLAENIGVHCHYKTELLRQAQSADNELQIETDSQENAATKIAELEARVAELQANLTANLNRTVTVRQPEANQPLTGHEVKDQHQHQDKDQDQIHHHRTRARLAPQLQNENDENDENDARLLVMQELALDIAADCTEWLGAEHVIKTEFNNPAQLANALTWLWLWELYDYQPNYDPYMQVDIHSRYTKDPFRRPDNHIGVMITQIRRGNRAPLHPADQAALDATIAERIVDKAQAACAHPTRVPDVLHRSA